LKFLQQNLAHICTLCAKIHANFDVKIIFYYMFSITRPKHKFTYMTMRIHAPSELSPMKQCDYSSVVVTFF